MLPIRPTRRPYQFTIAWSPCQYPYYQRARGQRQPRPLLAAASEGWYYSVCEANVQRRRERIVLPAQPGASVASRESPGSRLGSSDIFDGEREPRQTIDVVARDGPRVILWTIEREAIVETIGFPTDAK